MDQKGLIYFKLSLGPLIRFVYSFVFPKVLFRKVHMQRQFLDNLLNTVDLSHGKWKLDETNRKA